MELHQTYTFLDNIIECIVKYTSYLGLEIYINRKIICLEVDFNVSYKMCLKLIEF